MKIDDNLWLESAYYIDIDEHEQLRIAGPDNHLYFATVGLNQADFEVEDVKLLASGEVKISGRFKHSKLFFHDPAIGPMLRVRGLIEPPGKPKPTFAQVMRRHPDAILPHFVGGEATERGFELTYRRFYENTWYGVKITLDKSVEVHRQQSHHGYWLKSRTAKPISFKLTTDNPKPPRPEVSHAVAKTRVNSSADRGGLMNRLSGEIDFLIRNDRTSGFDYGTVFPRDWMESADLGEGDLLLNVRRYMYSKALALVNPVGIGWHENITGELEAEKSRQADEFPGSLDDLLERESRLGRLMQDLVKKVQEMYIIRNMIDIEPHYILGLQRIKPSDFSEHDQERLKRSAHYLVSEAAANDLITFKKIPELFRRHRREEYYGAGNWRDSERAFKMVHPIIAPYDVNAVFYPQALELIKQHAQFFGFPEATLTHLVAKWSKVKDLYRFINRDGETAMALALYDIKSEDGKLQYRTLEVNHTDEAYDLFYGEPTEADLDSFCRRLLSEKYFYTPAGPTLVGAKDGYSTLDYHGRVSWTKQTAFVTAGLVRQLESSRFSEKTCQLLQETLVKTAEASLSAINQIGATELHYHKNGKAHFYNDQSRAEGPMNKVQLWSAVGARAIVRHHTWAQKNLAKPAKV